MRGIIKLKAAMAFRKPKPLGLITNDLAAAQVHAETLVGACLAHLPPCISLHFALEARHTPPLLTASATDWLISAPIGSPDAWELSRLTLFDGPDTQGQAWLRCCDVPFRGRTWKLLGLGTGNLPVFSFRLFTD